MIKDWCLNLPWLHKKVGCLVETLGKANDSFRCFGNEIASPPKYKNQFSPDCNAQQGPPIWSIILWENIIGICHCSQLWNFATILPNISTITLQRGDASGWTGFEPLRRQQTETAGGQLSVWAAVEITTSAPSRREGHLQSPVLD